MASEKLIPDPELVLDRLAREFGFPRHGNPKDVFYCAVYVLLSAQTTLEQATAALRTLRRRWPTPGALSLARPAAIRRAVHSCGFGTTRTRQIRALARAVAARQSSLRSLRHLSDTELEAELVALPGIAFKTARVVAAMSSFERDRFAIDTHIWRIAQRLGWIPVRRTNRKPTERQADALEAVIPAGLRRQLHACLVAHGRTYCKPLRPVCESCPLADMCVYGLSSAVRSRCEPATRVAGSGSAGAARVAKPRLPAAR